jgi:hypothetical protein
LGINRFDQGMKTGKVFDETLEQRNEKEEVLWNSEVR